MAAARLIPGTLARPVPRLFRLRPKWLELGACEPLPFFNVCFYLRLPVAMATMSMASDDIAADDQLVIWPAKIVCDRLPSPSGRNATVW